MYLFVETYIFKLFFIAHAQYRDEPLQIPQIIFLIKIKIALALKSWMCDIIKIKFKFCKGYSCIRRAK